MPLTIYTAITLQGISSGDQDGKWADNSATLQTAVQLTVYGNVFMDEICD